MAARKKPVDGGLRAAIIDPWRNLRHEIIDVPEWGAKVVLRGLTIAEWREYNRMAVTLATAAETPADEAEPREPAPWEAHGDRALFAFLLVCALHDENRQRIFGVDPAQIRNDVAEVAASYTGVHDGLAGRVFELSGMTAAKDADPVAEAGNA
ncbi:phage tail assembly chaperone [Stutzerimonas stutzeri]|uniref:phage tail assembly chaperone n=1 Tax=Stutzerimonas stutzeri TaxID=316 RepID=UPI002109DC4E|nr:phage tail assembly chaperone [Stutzerimonas stutzeri]MCQ4257475.1 phage tail assembly chaperone [Stutzerimonas stutzeri]